MRKTSSWRSQRVDCIPRFLTITLRIISVAQFSIYILAFLHYFYILILAQTISYYCFKKLETNFGQQLAFVNRVLLVDSTFCYLYITCCDPYTCDVLCVRNSPTSFWRHCRGGRTQLESLLGTELFILFTRLEKALFFINQQTLELLDLKVVDFGKVIECQ